MSDPFDPRDRSSVPLRPRVIEVERAPGRAARAESAPQRDRDGADRARRRRPSRRSPAVARAAAAAQPRGAARACRRSASSSPAGSPSMPLVGSPRRSSAALRSASLAAVAVAAGVGGCGRGDRARTHQPVPAQERRGDPPALSDRLDLAAAAGCARAPSPRFWRWCRGARRATLRSRRSSARCRLHHTVGPADRDPLAHGDEAARPPRRGAYAHRRAARLRHHRDQPDRDERRAVLPRLRRAHGARHRRVLRPPPDRRRPLSISCGGCCSRPESSAPSTLPRPR